MVWLKVASEELANIQISVTANDNRQVQIQTHPNIDKKAFNETGVVRMKQAGRPFPLNTDVGVLKWRFQTTDSMDLPLVRSDRIFGSVRFGSVVRCFFGGSVRFGGNFDRTTEFFVQKLARIRAFSAIIFQIFLKKLNIYIGNVWYGSVRFGNRNSVRFDRKTYERRLSFVEL
eukprot:sb/3472076/